MKVSLDKMHVVLKELFWEQGTSPIFIFNVDSNYKLELDDEVVEKYCDVSQTHTRTLLRLAGAAAVFCWTTLKQQMGSVPEGDM